MSSANATADMAMLEIRGITCSHCEAAVSAALKEAGATVVTIDHTRGQEVVENDGANEGEIREALASAGYQLAALHQQPETDTSIAGSLSASSSRDDWSLKDAGTGLGAGAVLLVCCASHLLTASVAAGGAGAWLAANGAVLVGVGSVLVAVTIGVVAILGRD